MVYKHYFGRTPEGEAVTRFTLFNHNSMEVNLLNFGAMIHSICTPDREGRVADIVLGCDSIEDYLAAPHFGGTIGRVANRLGKARCTLNGKEYSLAANVGENHLHGGLCGFDHRLWKWRTEDMDNLVVFSRTSEAGEEGYPGKLEIEVSFCLTNDDALIIHYTATTDADTILNLTNHTYFNLAGQGSGDILGHVLELNSTSFTPCNAQQLPTGEICKTAGTALDFSTPHRVGERIDAEEEQLHLAGGYDHNWILDYDRDAENPLHPAAELGDPGSGRKVTAYTTEPAVQVYTGNFLNGERGKGGVRYQKRSGICLETQHYPDSMQHPEFPSIILCAGERFDSETVFFFGLTEEGQKESTK